MTLSLYKALIISSDSLIILNRIMGFFDKSFRQHSNSNHSAKVVILDNSNLFFRSVTVYDS